MNNVLDKTVTHVSTLLEQQGVARRSATKYGSIIDGTASTGRQERATLALKCPRSAGEIYLLLKYLIVERVRYKDGD